MSKVPGLRFPQKRDPIEKERRRLSFPVYKIHTPAVLIFYSCPHHADTHFIVWTTAEPQQCIMPSADPSSFVDNNASALSPGLSLSATVTYRQMDTAWISKRNLHLLTRRKEKHQGGISHSSAHPTIDTCDSRGTLIRKDINRERNLNSMMKGHSWDEISILVILEMRIKWL